MKGCRGLWAKSLGLCFVVSGGWVLPGAAQSFIPRQVLNVNGLKPVSNRAADLVGQAPADATQPIRITDVQLKPTDAGLEVVLKTEAGNSVQPVTRTEGNILIAEVANATLALTTGPGFTANQPMVGVDTVSVIQIDAKTVEVRVVGTKAAPTASVRLSPSTPVAEKPTTSEEEMPDGEEEEIVATGQQEGGYAVPNASVGTRTDAKLRDVPQSIQVIPKQLLEDQGATDFVDALRNVPGVNTDGNAGSFEIRGFEGNTFSNGAGSPPAASSFNDFDLSNIEQIEVLKGPASVLFGSGSPGGTVNIVTEQPLKDPRYELKGTIGNFDFYRADLDLTGPLNKSKTILYRLNAAYENAGSFIDFLNSERFSIFPVLKFEVGKRTNLTLEGGYQTISDGGFADGLPLTGTVLPNPLGEIPRSRNRADPRNRSEARSAYVGYFLEHGFSEDWSLRNRFRASFTSVESFTIRGGDDLDADNQTQLRVGSEDARNEQAYSFQTEAVGKVQTGIVKHDLLLGLELTRSESAEEFRGGDATPINIFDPDYGEFPNPNELPLTSLGRSRSDGVGVYAQNLLSIGDKIKILLGGRFDWVSEKFEDRLNNTSSNSKDSGFSPRIGLVYQPIKTVSLYGSWSRSYEPSFGTDRQGNPFVPVTGDQFEVGVKTDFLNGKLAATVAAYQITRQNDFITDPVDPDFSIQLGEQRSRGVEFDLKGEPLPGLKLIATYAYTDVRITKDEAGGNEGNRIDNTPPHSGSLWAVYEVQKGDLKGFGLGAGVFVVGKRPGDTSNTYTLPAYARTDALLYYRRNNWRVQLNIENLFDVRYFTRAFDRGSVFDGAPFTIKGQLSVTF